MQRSVIEQWMAAASDPEIRGELDAVYADVAAQIEARGPACWASGRCCNFETAGHLLYVTGLEAAYTVVGLKRHGSENRATKDRHGSENRSTEDRATKDIVQAPGCVFQIGNLCTVHGIKPLGCRVYFCDRSAQEWQHELSEHGLRQIRAVHERRGIEYRYGEWRLMLAAVLEASGGELRP